MVTLRETLVERCPTNYTGDMDSMLLRREDAGENTDTSSKGCYFDSIETTIYREIGLILDSFQQS